MLEHKDFPINSIWSICKSWLNNPVYNNRDKSDRFVPKSSAMINSVHFLLGAMFPCSTPFCTSAQEVLSQTDTLTNDFERLWDCPLIKCTCQQHNAHIKVKQNDFRFARLESTFAKLSSSWQVQCQLNCELRLVL